ncbi:kinesin-like boursin [Cryptosporidium ubiquitum]|uniref:Kinesin-like boursin n=1 Tax=Cryptosporidium ubiquitum TaxID=857276 RepID=A0A1J4MJZ6_9CRYT|nr:kinesin-like boursin [Cryptosporidium ubiquitum]OII73340.1 kinesin-like boursin [Cryptosporidium ubiquitum]
MKNLKPRQNTIEENGVNVKVIVRCRPLTEQEKKDPSNSNVLQVKPDSKEIVVSHHSLSRKFDSYSTKLFTFDGVCGSFTSQRELFKQYVVPIVDEVLLGFNCTIFAYGQTGTGKTYTMEGDMKEYLESNNMELTEHAGIIPRAVQLIFERLESQHTEYGVRVSYLEIYNEELSDLLSDEKLSLRIYDDIAGKRGLNVDRLEEIPVNKAQDILNILSTAVRKRRTAETLLNKSSSRSHCIFTITIHTKETNIDGEDVLKVGKLNLVDLAGSENIQRSGANAVKDRAKEAGMINQSLLTLGRVINALVEHSSYVPYRDSKLTRLLQDSLGGRTKTCIIATITASSIYLEETLNTLDYAHRAKNIKNMPVVNQKMTKKVMIREMNCEIEKLKQELQCNREKNGVYLPLSQFNEMENKLQSQANEIVEMESELQNQHALYREMESTVSHLTDQLNEKSLRVKAGDFANIHVSKHAKLYREKYQDLYMQMNQSLENIGKLHRKIIGSELFQSCQNTQLFKLQQQLVSDIQLTEKRTRECLEILHNDLKQDLLVHWLNKSQLSHTEIIGMIETGKKLCGNVTSMLSDSLEQSLIEELRVGMNNAKDNLKKSLKTQEEMATRIKDEIRKSLVDCSTNTEKISMDISNQLERLKLSNERCQSLVQDYKEHSKGCEVQLDTVFSQYLVNSVDNLAKSHQIQLDNRLSVQLSSLDEKSKEMKNQFCKLVDSFVEETSKALVDEKDQLFKQMDDLKEKIISELENGYLANKNLLRETNCRIEQLELAQLELVKDQSECLEKRRNELGELVHSISQLGEKRLIGGFTDFANVRDEQFGLISSKFTEISELSASSVQSCVNNVSTVVSMQNNSLNELSSCIDDYFGYNFKSFQENIQVKISEITQLLGQITDFSCPSYEKSEDNEKRETSSSSVEELPKILDKVFQELIEIENVVTKTNPISGQTPSRRQSYKIPVLKERCLSPMKYVEHYIETLPRPNIDFNQTHKMSDPFYNENGREDMMNSRLNFEQEDLHHQSSFDWKSVQWDDIKSLNISQFIQETNTASSDLFLREREQESSTNDENWNGYSENTLNVTHHASIITSKLEQKQSSLDSLKSLSFYQTSPNDENRISAQENTVKQESLLETNNNPIGPSCYTNATASSSSTGIPRPGRPKKVAATRK